MVSIQQISLACLVAWSNPAGATIRYVNGATASGGNGSTWVLSYQNLQDAIDASTSSDEIWVMPVRMCLPKTLSAVQPLPSFEIKLFTSKTV